MMSEEEEEDCFVRHQPSWRSEEFNTFLNLLDERYSGKDHPKIKTKAFTRKLGCVIIQDPPISANPCMISEEYVRIISY